MDINHIIEDRHLSKYRLAKNSGIPYMTINDICSGKANLADCNARTIYKLSKELGISMEEMLEPYLLPRPAFELFKSNVCHRLKELGDINLYRKQKLTHILYPASVLTASAVMENEEIKTNAFKNAIPEFKRFNIVESEVRNVN